MQPANIKGRSVRAQVHKGFKDLSYRILSTTNLLVPVAGTYVKSNELEALIAEGVKVVVTKP